MLCERCKQREATVHLQAVSDGGGPALGQGALCVPCAGIPRRVGDADVRGVLALEASGRVMPAGWFARVATDIVRRATYHGDAIPPDVQAFVDRHRSAAP